MAYQHKDIERKWREEWRKRDTYRVANDTSKPKYYVLDMFPYPSGAGLHVGHPLGYIASDIVARYKRSQGFNVLHPMGYDSFGLPAEQYAIQTGQHPRLTTEQNIARYREQMDNIAFSFDWSREVRTSDPSFYKWTQWIFLQLFESWYDHEQGKARPITELIARFEQQGWHPTDPSALTGDVEEELGPFTAAEWKALEERTRQRVLQHFRLAYLSEAWVNWCPALGTVLANDEVKDGVSERGGHPVERKRMPQWSMRITAYAQRLLEGLDGLDWSESMKEAQRNWIGRSEGARISFKVKGGDAVVDVFTTRPDTVFGVTFVTLAPEHELIERITPSERREEVMAYVTQAKNRSERERQAEVKRVSGVFTGAYVQHPFTGKDIPIWVGDYVLGGYGTGAVMAVPGGDQRDWNFAKHFSLSIVAITKEADISKAADESRESTIANSDFLSGLKVSEAIKRAIQELEKIGAGEGRVNYRLRDAAFGRQRYWGEPIPIYYKDGVPYPLPESELPLKLPEIDKYQPTETGEPPLARAANWTYQGFPLETTTMPGWAGSSWYFLRYMDPKNEGRFASAAAINCWKQVDLYVGGSEHATGHLMYFRFWTKFLFDRGWIPFDEPAKKLVNQGMIQGMSTYPFATGRSALQKANSTGTLIFFLGEGGRRVQIPISQDRFRRLYYSADIKERIFSNSTTRQEGIMLTDIPINVMHVNGLKVDFTRMVREESREYVKEGIYATATGYWMDGKFYPYEDGDSESPFIIELVPEKMSKSKFNVQTPDELCEKYGADTLRLYEMFLGPLEQSKPWDTNGIEGTSRFLKKFWALYHDKQDQFGVSDDSPEKEELKVLHATIKKVGEDIERMSFNTSVSQFMIACNQLHELQCRKRAVLEPLVIVLAPFAPHIAEELWQILGNTESVTTATWPRWDAQYLVEDSFSYPISFNGKTRLQLEFPIALSKEEVEAGVLANPEVQKRLEGRPPKKVIVVPKRIVNIVV